MLLRPATPADAEGIARVEVAAWRHAYEEIVGPERLEYLDVAEHASDWRARLASSAGDADATGSDPGADDDRRPVTATVAEQAGMVVAFAAVVGPALAAIDQSGTDAETGESASATLVALYVHPVAQGAGVGTALLERAENGLRHAGAETAELRSFTANWWARRFFAARGWRHDAAAPAGDDDPPTERWVRALGVRVPD